VFGLFGNEEDNAPKQDSVDRNSIHDQLRKQAKVEEVRVKKMGAELEQAEIRTQELEDQIKTFQREMQDMKETKMLLITSTSKEIDRMRKMLRILHTSRGGETDEGKSATIS
jgi:predicted RNase H-like nuclease (RuvC/YqgF family)